MRNRHELARRNGVEVERWGGEAERQRAQRCEVPVILEHWSLLLFSAQGVKVRACRLFPDRLEPLPCR